MSPLFDDRFLARAQAGGNSARKPSGKLVCNLQVTAPEKRKRHFRTWEVAATAF